MNLTSLFLMAEKLELSYVIAVVITGLSVVFLGLIILILFVWAFGKIFTAVEKNSSKKKPQQVTEEEKFVPIRPISPKSSNNQDEIVAVIAAAVAAMGQADGKTYRVKSVRAVKNRPTRSAWALAGIQNETTPF